MTDGPENFKVHNNKEIKFRPLLYLYKKIKSGVDQRYNVNTRIISFFILVQQYDIFRHGLWNINHSKKLDIMEINEHKIYSVIEM